jgi:hypothetical protein
MSDERLRAAERQWRESGDDEDGWRYAQEVARAHPLDSVGVAKRLVKLERAMTLLLDEGRGNPPALARIASAFAEDATPADVVTLLTGGVTEAMMTCHHGVSEQQCLRCEQVRRFPNRLLLLRVAPEDQPEWLTPDAGDFTDPKRLGPNASMEGTPVNMVNIAPDIVAGSSRIMLGLVFDHAWRIEHLRGEERRRVLDLHLVADEHTIRMWHRNRYALDSRPIAPVFHRAATTTHMRDDTAWRLSHIELQPRRDPFATGNGSVVMRYYSG